MKLLTKRVGLITKVCSARCYNAVPESRCTCICQGQLHAIGEQGALEKIWENRFTWGGGFAWGGAMITRRAQRAIRRMEEKNAEAGN